MSEAVEDTGAPDTDASEAVEGTKDPGEDASEDPEGMREPEGTKESDVDTSEAPDMEEAETSEEVSDYNSDSEIVTELELGVTYPFTGYYYKTLTFTPEEDGFYNIERHIYDAAIIESEFTCDDGKSYPSIYANLFYGEAGKEYNLEWHLEWYLTEYVGPQNTWKIVKLQHKDIELGKSYTSKYDDLTYYTFTPEKPAVYRIHTNEGYKTNVLVEKKDENRSQVEFLYDEIILERGKQYTVFVLQGMENDTYTWELNKVADYVEVQKDVEYQETTIDQMLPYKFKVEEEGVYRLDHKRLGDRMGSFNKFKNEDGTVIRYDYVGWSSFYMQYYVTLKKGTYYFGLWNYEATNDQNFCDVWKIEKVFDKDLKLDQQESFSAENAIRYTYSPTETGLYQLSFDKGVSHQIIEDADQEELYYSISDRDYRKYTYYLRSGSKYNIYVSIPGDDANRTCDCKMQLAKIPLKKIEADTIYTKDENETGYYTFQAKTAGRYVVAGEVRKADLSFFDYNRRTYFNQGTDKYVLSLDENEEIILLVGEGENNVCISQMKETDGMEYVMGSDGTVGITGYKGDKKDIVIPDTIDGKRVASITSDAFKGAGLTSVQFSSTLESIGHDAFKDNLLTEIRIPDNVTEVGRGAFSDCAHLEKVTLGSGVQVLSYGMFRSCTSLTELIFPENSTVREIQYHAFADCNRLSEIVFPNTIEKCSNAIFGSNESFESFWYNDQPDGAIYIGQAFYKYKGTLPEGTNYTVKQGTASISPGAFIEQKGLSEVTLPDGLKDIGEWAFSGTDLQEIVIPDSVTDVGEGAFSECVSLKKATIGSGVKAISNRMFESCKSLEEVVFPKNGTVREIQYDAFTDCTTLSEIEFPDTIERCDGEIFGDNEDTNSTWYKYQPDGVVYVGNVVYKYKGTAPKGTKVKIKPGTVSINPKAFFGQAGVSEVILPYGLRQIGGCAFVVSNSMQSIVIPETVTEIGIHAIGYVPDTERNNNSRRGPGLVYRRKVGFIIYGKKGSEAERYADGYGFQFIEKSMLVKGDVDLSGNVDISDLRMMLRAVCSKVTLTTEQVQAGDITGQNDMPDGTVNIADLRKLLRFICKKIETL